MNDPRMSEKADTQKLQNETEISFEEALTRLEQIVKGLESGELSLEASIEGFQEGMLLAKLCKDRLDQAEQKIEMLVTQGDTYTRKTFSPEE